MDVVIKEIEDNLNGRVILNSKKDAGTSFILEIPKAETLSECIKFGDETSIYAIPVVPGIEFLECENEYVNNLLGRTAMYTKGDLTFPLVNLFVELEHEEYYDRSTQFMPIIRIGKDKDQFGIIVPKILGTERIKIDRRKSFNSLTGDSGLVFGYGLTNPVTIILDIDRIRNMVKL
jgi:chemotaxis protein histidine kinase CheA